MIKHKISTFAGKIILVVLRLTGRSGSALPGLIVEKIDKKYLKRSLDQLPGGFLVVTGTNGKTTTTKIISEVLEQSGMRVLTNRTGSNFVRGVISAIVDETAWSGKLPYDIAVIEQDEAHAVHMVNYAEPRGVVALNVMRDQLDRFGEIDHTAKLIAKVASKAKEFVVLNTNDPRIGKFEDQLKDKKIVWFGHAHNLAGDFRSDDQHHSGGEAMFYEARKPEVCLLSQDHGKLRIRIGSKAHDLKVKLDGPHNAINTTAAAATILEIIKVVDARAILNMLSMVEPAFGRGESIKLKNGAAMRIQLIKNPAGFTHSLKLLDKESYKTIGIMINDNHPDGRDVSWLWDVKYDGLVGIKSILVCGGIRGWDMALRLKYDDVAVPRIEVDVDKFIKYVYESLEEKDKAVIFCTYTAMLKLRSKLPRYSKDIKGAIL